ncbi:sodium-dependent lysophosphatidylcholine symporter 1-like [Lingula anatina]|uniref:Sodium-dependent lysophosphatidylcholine symporter 1-like n=1 Tax=Lingula anatina TaxID=7574 RepID=A0A1S3HGU2_LINAN|nr:sodium-dependent lysophosphatidylcholine symporter 1-like [Lingula anatina]|eukprot:XP_013384239.1 sodium-dependent lysophosphatidylcholine symporter 1-like [Lingula anatina]
MAIAGSSISVAYLLPWSMLPDVLDDFLLKTGHRKDAIFYSFYVFFNKFAVGLSVGLSQVALGLSGYKSQQCDQVPSVGLALRMLVAPFPIVCLLIGLMFLWRYPITEERRKIIKEQLARQNEGLSPSADMSGAYVKYETIEDTC